MATGRPPGPGRGHRRKIGNGAGWGGPARGAGSSSESLPLIGRERELPTVEAQMTGRQRAEQRAEELRELLYGIATDVEQPGMVRVSAADKLLDRLEGKPVATNVNITRNDFSSMSDAELASELARMEREASEVAARILAARGEEPPGNVPPVH